MMITHRGLVAVSLALSLSASAQQTAPAPAVAPAPAPVAAAPQPQAKPEPQTHDSVRLRGGFTLGGGAVFGAFGGPIIDVSLRLGLQFGRYFGLLVQSQPNVFIVTSAGGAVVGAGINNSLLAELTLLDHLQLGAGPSFDYVSGAGCAADGTCTTASGAGFGLHARAALVLGGRNPMNGSRSGFSLSVNLHPIFLASGTLFFTTFGIGGDWF